MPWLRITFEASAEDASTISAMMELCGALAVTTEGSDAELRLQAVNEPQPLWPSNRITGLFPEHTDSTAVACQIATALGGSLPAYTVDSLADADWSSAWMANYRPIAVTDTLWICPSWIAPPRPDAVNIVLDPGMAFGTGDHPTTELCLRWLAEQNLRDRTVIDFGSGSGILSIAALKLGARMAIGVEIDEQARTISMDNARRNGVDAGFTVTAPNELAKTTRADVVVANILASPLVSLAPAITNCIHPGGQLALSGMLTDQANAVASAYAPTFRFDRREQRGEWVLLAGTKLTDDGHETDG